MTRGDKAVIACVLVIVVASFVAAAAPVESDTIVLRGPYGATQLSPHDDGTYYVEGQMGDVVIQVHDGDVRCIESSCPDHVCVHSGSLAPGKPIVCAPNGVVVAFEGRGGDDLDAVSR